jgi:hypothetical protein
MTASLPPGVLRVFRVSVVNHDETQKRRERRLAVAASWRSVLPAEEDEKWRDRPRQPRHDSVRAGGLLSYIFPSVSSASRTWASVKLEVFGYF